MKQNLIAAIPKIHEELGKKFGFDDCFHVDDEFYYFENDFETLKKMNEKMPLFVKIKITFIRSKVNFYIYPDYDNMDEDVFFTNSPFAGLLRRANYYDSDKQK